VAHAKNLISRPRPKCQSWDRYQKYSLNTETGLILLICQNEKTCRL